MGRSKKVTFPQFGNVLSKGLLKPLNEGVKYFKVLGAQVDRDTLLNFKTEGVRSNAKWKRFSPQTLQTKAGTFNIRYGTDLKGRHKGSYTPGVKRPGIRRYASNSKLLQASGLFKQSFRIMKIKRNEMKYGTNHKLAGKIGSKPVRQVLMVTNSDRLRYRTMFVKYMDGGIKF